MTKGNVKDVIRSDCLLSSTELFSLNPCRIIVWIENETITAALKDLKRKMTIIHTKNTFLNTLSICSMLNSNSAKKLNQQDISTVVVFLLTFSSRISLSVDVLCK